LYGWTKDLISDGFLGTGPIDWRTQRPLGILSLLDEETRFPKATDQTLLLKIQTNHRKHKHFEDTRRTPNSFGIKHYAGEVPPSPYHFISLINFEQLRLRLIVEF
jgi:myosin heavy subunit